MRFLTLPRVTTLTRSQPAELLTAEGKLHPAAVRRGLRLSAVEGALSNIHISITMGAFQTGFALLLGARDFELGVLGALPFVGQLFQFVGAYLEERFGERKRLVLYTATASRALWILIAALPFMSWLGSAQLTLFLLTLAVSQGLIGITANAWTSWMSDLVPPRERGRYFGTRNTIASITAMLGTWLAGLALDHYRVIGDEPLGYAVIFGSGVLFAMLGLFVLRFQPEPPMQRRQEKLKVAELFSAPIRHRSFRVFAFASAGWAVATGIAAPFFTAYGLQNLGMSFQTLALSAIVTGGVALFTQPFIGRLQDRFGDKAVIVGSTMGVVLMPWGWILSTPSFYLPMWIMSVFAGVFWPGINQGLMNLLMERAPAEGRGAYVAAFGAINGVGTVVASLLGGMLASVFSGLALQLGPVLIGHYALLFLLTSIARGVMVFVFARKL